ncbi:hypothetical protein [Sphingomonas carotinifaciens]|uniref:hypothetical protein n=1 Tax=Sphingomonas carotinifaciens TaxID=1166323 RepID=UPI000DDBAB69|nr:hypothetical protein [Sphingomonas carotinifaciens]
MSGGKRARAKGGGRRLPWLTLLLLAAVVVLAVLWWRERAANEAPRPAATPAATADVPPATPNVAGLLPDERLAAAVKAAFPAGNTAESESGEHYVFDEHRLVDAPFGPVLVSEGQVAEPAHVSAGRLDITYLKPDGERYAVDRRFPEAVLAGSMGRMSDWSVSNKLGRLPVVQAQGGGTWQGYTCGRTTLVELQPTGPVKLADFLDSYDDGGAAVGRPQSSQGKIVKIVPDQSFTVRFTGTRAFEARYVRVGGAYRVEGGEANMLQGC